jgi:hypothetical protein
MQMPNPSILNDVDAAAEIEGAATPVVRVAVVIASRVAVIVGAVAAAGTKLATEEAGVAETDVSRIV